MQKTINSHNGWDPLQEVWLGDVYPSSWYDHLEPAVRDVFHELTELTQQDLSTIQHKLESMGVTVQRPCYESIDDYVLEDRLIKPQICPRDMFIALGNTLYVTPTAANSKAWIHTYDRYQQNSTVVKLAHPNSFFNGANVVRAGRDVIVDYCRDNNSNTQLLFDKRVQGINQLLKGYRVHTEVNGGHLDGCFSILRPGLILANNYFDGYERNFPGWEVIVLSQPEFAQIKHQQKIISNGKFWYAGEATNKSFNEHVVKHAIDWVGCYTETYFELNCLVVDPKNVIMLAENTRLAEQLDQRGITVHWVPFRTRRFWDGAMHCLTVDIRRDSVIEDYFPERS